MLALVALGLGGGLGTVLIPASDSTETLGPFGSSPALDRLFSTEALALETDSVALGRVAKGLWLARERPDLLAELKVCHEENRPGNCGRCSKCLLTMATLRAAGALAAAQQFPDALDLDLIATTPMRSFQPRAEWAELGRAVRDGRDPELHAAILAALARPGWAYPGPPPRDDTPDFRARHNALIVSVVRDRAPWPAAPFAAPPGHGLVRAVDARAGRHVYAVGRVPPGELAAELGSVPRGAAQDLEPLWATADGRLVTPAGEAEPKRPPLLALARWALAPLAWRDVGLGPAERAGAVRWRVSRLARDRGQRSRAPVGVVGHLHRHPQPGRLPLLSALHPVTGDQLLATSEWEAVDMGYGPPRLLGYLDGLAP